MPLPKPKLIEYDGRIATRKACNWPAILKRHPQNLSCIVEDISEGGCRISVTTRLLKIGDEVQLDLVSKQVTFNAEITWVNTGEAGLKFSAFRLYGEEK